MSEGEQADESQKTEEPTPKRLEESRKKGQVALSREVNNWTMLFAGTIVIGAMGGNLLSGIQEILTFMVAGAHEMPHGVGGITFILYETFKRVMALMAVPLIVLLMAAFFAPFIQVGPLFAPEAIKPDISKISPIKGFSRLFSKRSIMEFLKGIMKIVVIGAVGGVILFPYFETFEHMIGLPMALLMNEIRILFIKLMMGVLIVLIVIAVIDITYQRNDHYKKMRMTKQELKDEYKQTEGDPHVKARLRQLRSERGRQRMMQAVPQADVVITNPTHYAIALKYDSDQMEAPLCLAKGTDDLALRIREVAKEHEIIIYEDKPLARTLYDVVEIDESIPYEHFRAVAEVISYVFRMKGKLN